MQRVGDPVSQGGCGAAAVKALVVVIDAFGEEQQHLCERDDPSKDQAGLSDNELQKTHRFLFEYKCSRIKL